MIRIAVCDGDEPFRECLKGYIDNCLSAGTEEYLVDMFSSGADLLDMGIELARYEVVFIEMNRKSGNKMETVLWLKQYCADSCVVIVADDKRYCVEGYRADVFRYLIKGKGDFEALTAECMQSFLEKRRRIVSRKQFSFRECEKDVPAERILYVESKLHKLEFHVMEERMTSYTLYQTLNVMEQELRELHFVRVHQSYLVNLRHVKDVVCYKVILNNHQEVKIAKTRYKDVKRAFLEYRGNGMSRHG